MRRLLAISLLLFLGACGGGGGPTTSQVVPTIAIEGDSLADPVYSAWAPDLAVTLPANYINNAKGGRRAEESLAQFDPVFGNVHGDIYILMVGTNNLVDTDVEAGWAAIKATWAKARANGFKVIAVTVQAEGNALIKANKLELNARIRANSSLYDGLLELDVLFPMPIEPGMYDGNGPHFSAAGNQRIAAAMLTVVKGLR